MPQIAAGANASFTVPAGGSITIQCREGWVQLEYPSGTKIYEGNPANQVFGPFAGGTAKITSVQGAVYYETSAQANTTIPAFTWAALPSAASNAGLMVRVTDIGAFGALYVSNGARWRAVNGAATLASLGASVSGIGTTEQIVLQAFLPAGSWQANDILRINNLSLGKSGTTDGGRVTVRVGTAGTTADTAITGLSAFSSLTATQLSSGYAFDVKLVNVTSALKVGNNASNSTAFSGGNTTAAAAATTISDSSANGLWVSVSLSSTGSTNTVSIEAGQIQMVTP